ncbi:MAG: cytidylate kinase-like family protein [Balneolales bacterium]|nr:cytidylate kinase-like family protein [Balneolales bacterium]
MSFDKKLTPKPVKSVSDYVQEIKSNLSYVTSDKNVKRLPTITISREFGCAGFPLAQALIKKLSAKDFQWKMYSHDLLDAITEEHDLAKEIESTVGDSTRNKLLQDLQELLNVENSDFTRYKNLAQNVRIIGESGGAVIVGSGASIIARKELRFFNVRLTGSFAFRTNRIMDELGISRYEAEKLVTERTSRRLKFIQEFTRQDISNPALYHLIFRNDFFEVDVMADLIIDAMKKTRLL